MKTSKCIEIPFHTEKGGCGELEPMALSITIIHVIQIVLEHNCICHFEDINVLPLAEKRELNRVSLNCVP